MVSKKKSKKKIKTKSKSSKKKIKTKPKEKYKNAKYCSPNKYGVKCGTCFNKTTLIKMASIIQPNDKIKNKSKMELWELIRENMSNQCNTEWCWLEQNQSLRDVLTNEEISGTFKPSKPDKWYDDKYTWLTTGDINKVMKQYEKKYKDYVFFGPVPSDCPNGYTCELTGMNIKKMYNSGIKRIGIIYNLDKHNQRGSHWVAVYITLKSIKKPEIIYYDSYGEEPPNDIKKFMEYVKNKIDDIKQSGDVKVIYNKKRHQYGNSECGIFSMTYILLSLFGLSHKKIINGTIMKDKIMNEIRDRMYRPS